MCCCIQDSCTRDVSLSTIVAWKQERCILFLLLAPAALPALWMILASASANLLHCLTLLASACCPFCHSLCFLLFSYSLLLLASCFCCLLCCSHCHSHCHLLCCSLTLFSLSIFDNMYVENLPTKYSNLQRPTRRKPTESYAR